MAKTKVTYTMEELIGKLDEKYNVVDEKATAWEAEAKKDNPNLSVLSDLMNEINDATKDYNALKLHQCFMQCAQENPENVLIPAVMKLRYDVLTVKEEEDDLEQITLKISHKKKDIPLDALAKRYGDKCGVDPAWILDCQKLNQLLTFAVAVEACNKDEELLKAWAEKQKSYYISDLAKDRELFKLGNGANPVSKTSVAKNIAKIVGEMIGEEYAEKVISYHAGYALMKYFGNKSKNRKAVACASHRNCYDIVADICNMILTSTGYTVESKEFKNK